jgi:hypothetical protein
MKRQRKSPVILLIANLLEYLPEVACTWYSGYLPGQVVYMGLL